MLVSPNFEIKGLFLTRKFERVRPNFGTKFVKNILLGAQTSPSSFFRMLNSRFYYANRVQDHPIVLNRYLACPIFLPIFLASESALNLWFARFVRYCVLCQWRANCFNNFDWFLKLLVRHIARNRCTEMEILRALVAILLRNETTLFRTNGKVIRIRSDVMIVGKERKKLKLC